LCVIAKFGLMPFERLTKPESDFTAQGAQMSPRLGTQRFVQVLFKPKGEPMAIFVMHGSLICLTGALSAPVWQSKGVAIGKRVGGFNYFYFVGA
jgi:hypothetical protein